MKLISKRKLVLILFTVSISAFLAGCGSGSAGTGVGGTGQSFTTVINGHVVSTVPVLHPIYSIYSASTGKVPKYLMPSQINLAPGESMKLSFGVLGTTLNPPKVEANAIIGLDSLNTNPSEIPTDAYSNLTSTIAPLSEVNANSLNYMFPSDCNLDASTSPSAQYCDGQYYEYIQQSVTFTRNVTTDGSVSFSIDGGTAAVTPASIAAALSSGSGGLNVQLADTATSFVNGASAGFGTSFSIK